MITRGRFFVHAKRLDGSHGPVDVLDLEDDSFKAWVVGSLVRIGAFVPHPDPGLTQPNPDQIELRSKI